MGDGPGRDVDHRLTVPSNPQPVAVGDFTDHGGKHVPLAAHRHERLDILRRHYGAHALLRLTGQHLGRAHIRRAQWDLIKFYDHASITGGCQF